MDENLKEKFNVAYLINQRMDFLLHWAVEVRFSVPFVSGRSQRDFFGCMLC